MVAPLETTRTSTSTATSVVTTTLPEVTSTTSVTLPQATMTTTLPLVTTTTSVTLPKATVTSTVNVTATIVSWTTVTVTVSSPPPACNSAASQGATGQVPTTIGTSTEASATNSSSERKTIVAAGLVWVFYTDGCDVVYQTSADGGKTWPAPPTVARAGIERGWFFTVAQNGSTLYLVVSASDGSTNGFVAFRSGTMKSDGTIGWSTAEQDVPFSVGDATVPTVALDTSGNVWTAIETLASYGRHIEVFKTTGGTWSKVFDIGGLADYPRPILLPLASGKMALEVLTETPGQRTVDIYTTAEGGGWNDPVSTEGVNILTLSSVSVGDTVYSVTSDTSGNVDLWTYAYGSSSFVGPTALAKCCLGYSDATISTDGASFLFVAYSNSSSVLYETSKDSGATWSSPTAAATAENQVQPGSLATNYLTSGLVSVVWTAQDARGSPLFDVRFAPVTY
jgi:Neuraminidase (sialidase)